MSQIEGYEKYLRNDDLLEWKHLLRLRRSASTMMKRKGGKMPCLSLDD